MSGLVDLIDNLDRLLSEGRPISELKPHCITIRDQAEALEARVRELEAQTKNDAIALERDSLQSELQTALKEIDRLKKQTEEKRTEDLSEDPTTILIFLVERGNTVSALIADKLRLNQQAVEFHLEELKRRDFVFATYNQYAPTRWHLDHEGRRYLIERGLIK